MEELAPLIGKTHELAYALDTFYLLISGAFVMWMAAGFAMLESGLVRSKNTAEILLKNMALFAIACIMYLLIGYQLMYPSDPLSEWLPNLGFLINPEHSVDAIRQGGEDAPVYASGADFFFQVVFVATAMSIVSGAMAERTKLWSFIVFAIVMTTVIYPLQGYWKWGGGFLDQQGFSDFAGSGVVHLCGAVAALTGAILVGPRMGKYAMDGSIHPIPGANLPLATLGTFILWMGWFGFNGGSQLIVSDALNANTVAMVFVNTNMAAAGGVVAAMSVARLLFGKTDLTMALNGALAGLVAITAGPDTPDALLATMIGIIAGVLVVFSILLIDRKLKIDDPVGAISVHGVCGIWGLIAVPISNTDISIFSQLLGIAVIIAWVGVASSATWYVIRLIAGLRVDPEEEYTGLDLGECGLEAYPEFTSSD